MIYKSDWEETKERYELWWNHEYFGRCAIGVTAPKSAAQNEPPPPLHEKVEDRWLDIEYIAARNACAWENTYFGREAFPVWHPGYPGWAFLPSYFGATVTLAETTGWNAPLIAEGALTDYDYRNFKIDPGNKWWKLTLEMLKFSASFSKGKAVPSIGAFGGSGDTLASLRSSEKLLYDVMDCPEYVGKFDRYLMEVWIDVYNIFYDFIRDCAEGSTCWFPLWSPKKFYASQNDFSYMISPKTFIDVFLPTIEMQMNFLDHSVYHVDGIGAFAHVPALCELPNLQAIQILPGEGKPSPLHYMETLKYVQSKGKNLHISIIADEVETALENLSARGLFIGTACKTEEQARTLLKNCEKWSKDRRTSL